MVARGRRGVTLVEVMITVMIVGILFSLGPDLLKQVTRFYLLSRVRIQLQRDARAALSLMTRNIKQAQSNTIVIDNVAGQPYYSRITFYKEDGTSTQYYQSGSNLVMNAGGVHRTLTDCLRFVVFVLSESDDMTLVTVGLTLEKTIYEGGIKDLHMAIEKIQIMN